VIAPSFEADAREVLAKKVNLRLLELDTTKPLAPGLRARSIAGGLLVQRGDAVATPLQRAEVVAGAPPTSWADLELAWRVVMHVRSNAIAIVKDGATVGLGGGQTSRVEAVRQALRRAGEHAKGATLASDAFFPFRDSLDEIAAAGIRTVIQPGGSVRDAEVVEAAKAHGVTMLFTGERHFKH
jgi:phosphoribosylaminoimidazolecarboxamide formyltransferase/IMP cyclohydrolase